MEYKRLNKTDLSVSPICLGTVNYGSALSIKDSKWQLSQFLDKGGNFIDSAHIYGDWEPGLTGRSERAIGAWFKESGNRDKVIIATKGAHPDWGFMDIPRVKPTDIMADLEESLFFLNTEYIDLYFLHRDDPKVPVEEIIDCLDGACSQGKIRYYGCSNWSLERILAAEKYAESKGSNGFVVNQLMWSLADINFYNLPDKTFVLMDKETYQHHSLKGMNVMAYMSIAKAYFSRRQDKEELPESVTSVYDNKSNDAIFREGLKFLEDSSYNFMDLSLMYLMAQENIKTIPIASFDTPEQLEIGLSSWNKTYPKELLSKLGDLKQFVYWA